MQKTFLLLSLLLFCHLFADAQNTPNNFRNLQEEEQQRATTDKFMYYLETGKLDDALKLISPAYLKSKPNITDILTAYRKELLKYRDSTRPSIITVYLEKRYTTFRCRTYNSKGDYFHLDLYFNVGQPNSLIEKMWKKREQELYAERVELAKRVKEKENTGPPQPPDYDPPGVHLKRVKKN